MNASNFVERVFPEQVQYELWQEHLSRYFFASKFVASKIVLDVACGTGYGTDLISKTADIAIGVDVSREALAYAKKHYGKKTNTAFVLSDACYLPFRANVFDVAVSFETIEHIDNPELFLQQVACVLKLHRPLIISTPNSQASPRRETPQNPFHLREFNIKEFARLLSLDFKNLQFYGQNYYSIKTWLFLFLGDHMPLSFKILFRKFNKNLSKQHIQKIGLPQIIDPVYCVKKLWNIHPIYSPRFFIAIVKNRKT